MFLSEAATRKTPIQEMRARWKDLLKPDASELRSQKYWVVGGSYDTEHFDFGKVQTRRRNKNSKKIGFRCAVGAEVIVENLDGNGRRFVKSKQE